VRLHAHNGAVTVTTALKVQALYAAVNAEGPELTPDSAPPCHP
jgi:hypothetical protein